MNRQERWQFEQITDSWDVQNEALDFIHFYSVGKMSKEQIQQDIVMTDKQEQMAQVEFPGRQKTIRAIKRRRWQTWAAIAFAMNWDAGIPPNITLIRTKKVAAA